MNRLPHVIFTYTYTVVAIWMFFMFSPPAGMADDVTAHHGVNITEKIASVSTLHQGKPIRIQRHQDTEHVIDSSYAFTSRLCPPFCIQPMSLSKDVDTIGELEVLDYLKRIGEGDHDVMVIDSRTSEWVAFGMIPGAVNIPWTTLYYKSWEQKALTEILEFQFGAIRDDALWNFENAKTLILYCNGSWCGQSPTNIRSLLLLGYPPHKLKWYRGGMQSWKQLGLTVVTSEGEIVEDDG